MKFLCKCFFIIFIIKFFYFNTTTAQNKKLRLGINICGAEFGEKNLPGVFGTDYIYPTESTISYFANKGFTLFNLPFRWERLHQNFNEGLDSAELERILLFIQTCKKYEVDVIVTMQNFAAYQLVDKTIIQLGTKNLPNEQFGKSWKLIATALHKQPNIYGYDLMNEPRKIFGKDWLKAAQAAIDSIRTIDTLAYVIVDGENSSHTYDWKYDNDYLKKLTDKFDNIIYDAHCYFDYNHSGQYKYEQDRIINPNAGINVAKPFVEWLMKNKKKGMIGEFGVPPTPAWLNVMDKFLDYLLTNGVAANYWAAGPWWSDYPLSIEPVNGKDKPQMAILEKYLFYAGKIKTKTAE
jgi:endoglucanase